MVPGPRQLERAQLLLMNAALDDYDVNDGEFPMNESSSATNNRRPTPMASSSKSFSGLLKVSKNRADSADHPGKPVRKPRPKLDFNRLLKGSRGLGYLAVCARKNLRLSGQSGGEANDLSQICVYLQEWAKLVFPKMPLIELLVKVEELCQSRIMKACVPQILSRLKELGDGVSLSDLNEVQGEVLTKIETEEAEKALESIKSDFDLKSQIVPINPVDFNLDEILERHPSVRNNRRRERSEIIVSEEEEEDDDEDEFSKEMNGFIDDSSDHDHVLDRRDKNSESESESESEAEFSSDPETHHRRGITFNFTDDDSETDQQKRVHEHGVAIAKRSNGIIMDSDDD